MKKFKVSVAMTYWDSLIVEAETRDDAEIKALESFDLKNAWQGGGEAHTTEEIEELDVSSY